MKTLMAAFGLFFLKCFLLSGQQADFTYPHILAAPDDREAVLAKIENNSWAKAIYTEMVNNVKPYVERHVKNPDWILSRYLMNRVPGRRYTNAKSDRNGGQLVPYDTSRLMNLLNLETGKMERIDPPPTKYDRKIAGLKRVELRLPAYLIADKKLTI